MLHPVLVIFVLTIATSAWGAWTQAVVPGDAYGVAPAGTTVWAAGQVNNQISWAQFNAANGSVMLSCKSASCAVPPAVPQAYMNWSGRANNIASDNNNRPVLVGYEGPSGAATDFLVARQQSGGQFNILPINGGAGGRNEAKDVVVLGNNNAVAVGLWTLGSPVRQEIRVSVSNPAADEIAYASLVGAYVGNEASGEGVAALSDNSIVVVGRVWQTASNDQLYVNRLATTGSMAPLWSNPYVAGSPVSTDVAHDVAVGPSNFVAACGQRNSQFWVSRFGPNTGAEQPGWPYEVPGACYAVSVRSTTVTALGKDSSGNLFVTKRTGSNGVISGWPKTLSGVVCEKQACGLYFDPNGNVTVVARRNGNTYFHKWNASGGTILSFEDSTYGSTGRSVDALFFSSDNGLRLTRW